MGASASLNPPAFSVEPGNPVTTTITVRNDGHVVDEFTLSALGDGASWVTIEPSTLSLFPGAEGAATLTWLPPRAAATPPGPMAYAVRVASREDPGGSVVEEGVAHVGKFRDTFAELIPRTARGRRRGKHQLAVDNRGNTRLAAALGAMDADDALQFAFSPPSIEAEPGTASITELEVTPRKRFLRGPSVTRPFQAVLEVEGEPPVTVDGTLLQEALVPRWVPRALAAALVALLALAGLWLALLKPAVESAAKDAVAEPLASLQAAVEADGGGGPPPPPPSPVPGGRSESPLPRTTERPALPIDRRLTTNPGDQSDEYAVPAGRTFYLTDVVLSNPSSTEQQRGTLRLLRGDSTLLLVRLENFRDLDYHFVTPITFSGGQRVRLEVSCENVDGSRTDQCTTSALLVGSQR